jgi:hypothetical protein
MNTHCDMCFFFFTLSVYISKFVGFHLKINDMKRCKILSETQLHKHLFVINIKFKSLIRYQLKRVSNSTHFDQ